MQCQQVVPQKKLYQHIFRIQNNHIFADSLQVSILLQLLKTVTTAT